MNKKILLVDDDQDLIRSFQVNLEKHGYTVVTASNGKEGFSMLKAENPDLLVLDVMMDTNFDGYNLMHHIKADPVYSKLPIIILTGMSDQLGVNLYSGVEGIATLPNVHFQDKPIDPLKLVEIISGLLGD